MNIKFLKSVIFSFFLATILFTPFVSYGQDGFLAGQALESSQNACQTQHQVGTDAYNKCVEQARANLENAANPVVKPIVMIGEAAGNAFMKALFLPIGYFLITISSAILTFSGWIFDGIVKLTIIDVANYLGSGTDMGKAIFQAWSTLRDIANIFFIFVLIYAALKAMFDLNFGSSGTLIKNIILVALLINFSLFFTKVVIDASNVVSLGFYQSIANSNTATFSGRLTGTSDGVTEFKGITAGYMKMLGLQSMFDAGILTENLPVPDMMMISILGSLFLLIASVIFLISGIMFITRFVILIFLMILSPLALIAIIIPGGMATFNKWKDALISQSFFAPLFFALTWVAFKIGSALIVTRPSNTVWTELFTKPAASETGTTGILLNFTLVIGFSIAALVFAKSMATKTAGFTQISGAIGSGAVGGAAFIGRQTIGRGANMISENKREAWSKTTLGRAGLWMADKGRSASFNVGGLADTKLGKMTGANKILDPNIIGKTTGVGGFAKATEEKAKKKAEYAKRVYGQTSDENEALRRMELAYKGGFDENGEPIKGLENELSEMKRQEEEVIKKSRKENVELAQKAEEEAQTKVEENRRALEKAKTSMMPEQIKVAKMKLEESERDLELTKIKHKEAIQKQASKIEDDEFSEELKTLEREANEAKINIEKQKNLGKVRQLEYAKRLEKTPLVAEGLGAASGIYGGAALGALFGPLGILIGGAAGAATGAHLAGKLGSGGVAWAGNKSASRSVRALAEGKEKKDKKKLQEDLAKALGIEEDKKEDQQQN